MSIEDVSRRLNHLLQKDDRVLFAYLFGSTAKGEVAPLSDIDVAVYLSEVDPEALFDIKLSLHADLCRALKRNDVDLVVLNSTANNMLVEDIIRYGIVLYDRDTSAREDYEVMALHQAIDFKTQRLAIMGI